MVQKRVQNPTPRRGSFLEPFWVHFGSMLAPFWVPFRSQSRSKLLLGALGTPLENDSDFESPSRGAPAAVDVAPAWRRRDLPKLPRSSPSAILAKSAVKMRVGAVVAKNGALREGGSLRRTPDLPAVTEVTRHLRSLLPYAVRPPLFERARPGGS